MTVLAVMIFTISFVQCRQPENELEKQKKQVSELTAERDSLKDQGSTLTTELEEKERQVSTLRAELAEGREQVSMLGRELGEKEEQASTLRREEITKKFGHPSCYGEVEDRRGPLSAWQYSLAGSRV